MVSTMVVRDAELPGDLAAAVRALLDAAFEGEFAETDWHHTCGGWRVVLHEAGQPVAHAAVVPRTVTIGGQALDAGYVEGVAVAPERQRGSLGSRVMGLAAALIVEHHDIGVLSTSAAPFYERLGWERWRGPSFVIDRGDAVRTPDEDDGILVLRTGSTPTLSLDADIACECRAGDDW